MREKGCLQTAQKFIDLLQFLPTFNFFIPFKIDYETPAPQTSVNFAIWKDSGSCMAFSTVQAWHAD